MYNLFRRKGSISLCADRRNQRITGYYATNVTISPIYRDGGSFGWLGERAGPARLAQRGEAWLPGFLRAYLSRAIFSYLSTAAKFCSPELLNTYTQLDK